MNILLSIHEHLNPNSGAAGTTLRLGEQYVAAGHQVSYFSFDDLPNWLPIKLCDVLYPWFFAAHLESKLQTEHIDVVDAATGDLWLWANIYRHRHRARPLLVTRSHHLEHCDHQLNIEDARRNEVKISPIYPLYRGSVLLWQVAQSLRKADLVLLLNHEERDYAHRHLGVALERMQVVANGIPDSFLELPAPQPLAADTTEIAIAWVGTYILRKGIKYAEPALHNILTHFPQVQLSFLGTNCPAEQVYADFAPCFHNRIQVVPHFEHQQLPQLLANHQIYLLASTYEAFGKSLIEAMACGLAPVVTAVAGPLEVVKEGHDAVLIPPRDTQAIETALTHLLTNRSFLETIRQQAYQSAQRYSWTHTAQHRLSLYEGALATLRSVTPSAVPATNNYGSQLPGANQS